MDKQKIKNIKTVILDFDGTLVNLKVDWKKIKRNLNYYFKKWNLKVNFSPLYPRLSQALEILKRRGFSNKELNNIKKEAFSIISKEELKSENNFSLIEGSKEVVESLKENGFKIVILTNNDINLVKKIFKKSEFPKIDAIIGRTKEKHPKLSIEEIKKLLEKFTAKKEYILIGDSDYDISIGERINALTVLFCPKTNKTLKNTPSDFKIKSLLELNNIIKNKKLKI